MEFLARIGANSYCLCKLEPLEDLEGVVVRLDEYNDMRDTLLYDGYFACQFPKLSRKGPQILYGVVEC